MGVEIAEGGNAPHSPAVNLCGLEDLCPRCEGLARAKRAVLAAVEVYRRENGPGAVLRLAALAGVGESELRDMISCASVPIATWRRVGKALGVTAP